MASNYLNIVSFLLTTLLYYLALKPKLSLDIFNNQVEKDKYEKSNYMYLAIYFLIVIIIQLIINTSIIIGKCGGNITENIGYAGMATFFPWVFVFGMVIIFLIIYPNMKSIFSNVIGYFFISSSANSLLVNLLINKDIQKNIDKDVSVNPEEKVKMQDAADEIIKICGNTSVLINQFTPQNFSKYWGLLKPLMKRQYQAQPETPETTDIKQKLFELVVTKDNIGEVMWYIYTGFLVTSFVLMKITTRGCVNNQATMTANYQDFLKQEEQAQAQQKQQTDTVYTISS
mgnify:CR=1 FL=1